MQKNDITVFAQLMASIGELYSKKISKPLIEIYWQTLQQFDLNDIQYAFKMHINNPDYGQFFPKPADIVRFIEGCGETKALQAWTKVEKTIRQIGSYKSVAFDDSLIHAVIEDMGGWTKLCMSTAEELAFRANEFQKRYKGFLIKHPGYYPKYLCGLIEQNNARNGYHCEPPTLIGNAERIKAVISGGHNSIRLSIQKPTETIAELITSLHPDKQSN